MAAPPGAPQSASQGPGRSTAAEQRALREYAARLRPVIQQAIAAAQTAGAAGRPFTGAAQAVLKAAGLGAVTEGILSAVSLASLDRWTRLYAGSGKVSQDRRAALWDVRDASATAGATAGAARLADAIRDISAHSHRDVRERARRSSEDRVTAPAGQPLAAVPTPGQKVAQPYQFSDPDGLATAVAVTTKEAAAHAAAEAAGWTHKTWIDTHDTKVRVQHQILGAKGYDYHKVPVGEPFLAADGSKLMFPGDPSAPLSQTINCRCHLLYTAPK